jgi:polygalacturonase
MRIDTTPPAPDRRSFLKAAALTMLTPSACAALATAQKGHAPPATPLRLNVRDLGAVGDGVTLDTASLQRTIDRVNVLGGGEVVVPEGRYLTGGIILRSRVTLRLESGAVLLGSPDLAQYGIAQVRWEGKWIAGYTALVHALDASQFAIVGPGRIEGNAAVAGRPTADNPLRRPALIECINCQDVLLEGFSTEYRHMWSIHPTLCDRVVLRNLNVRSTETNGDGIDIDSCRHVLIDSCDIASGDDCISLKSGRGEEANQMARPTEDVRIVNCTLEGRGYACIGIGSETSGGIRDVAIEHCKVTSVYKFAIYIKSRVGRGASIENISVRDFEAANMRQGFLKISQTSAGIQDADPVAGLAGIPLFRNILFQRIRVDNAPVLLEAVEIAAQKPLDGFTFEDVSGSCAKAITLANVRNASLKNITVGGFAGPLLRTANVTGRSMPKAEPMPAPEATVPLQAPPVPYRLH